MIDDRGRHLTTRTTRLRAVAMLIAASLLITSCAGAGGGQGGAAYSDAGRPLTPAEQRMRQQADDFNQTLVEGAAIGAGIGAALGLLGGALAGGNRKSMMIGAVGGAAGGALAGLIAGSYYANKKEAYANEEDRLNAMIAEAQADTAKAETLLADTRTVVEADKRKLDELQKNLAARRITQEQARRELAAIDSNRQALQHSIDGLTKRRNERQQAVQEAKADINSPRIADLEAQIKTLDQQIALMQRELDAINSRRATVVG